MVVYLCRAMCHVHQGHFFGACVCTLRLKVPSWARPPARRDGSPWVLHLPDDGVLLSPMVEVFRDGTMHGYGFRETATVLTAVVPLARKHQKII